MSDTSPAYIGVHACGCVTAATVVRPGDEKDTAKFVAGLIADGMSVELTTVAEAKARPHFLVSECPHDPKGWTRTPPKERNRILYRRTHRDTSRVSVRVPRWPSGFGAGEVRKWKGKWWATPGWFNCHEAGAHYERDEPCIEYGPFAKQREAAEALIPYAEAASAQMAAEIDAGRNQAAKAAA